MIRLKVKEVAAEKGMSWHKLARKADMSYTTVIKVIRDPYAEISIITLGRLAEALEVSVHDLIEDAPNNSGASS